MPGPTALWKALQRDQRGVSSIEYALIAALIAMAIVTAVGALGIRVNGLYEMVVAVMPTMP
ncbi:Flp family type IVb pilin [Cupriavidus nantongensis]|uniref:Flp family type IVb pilin n=1 Tax=Cupriavidus nantongensis TaxID=1796606 RepID=UPI002246B487|nr:Flp family type IVb pilin [Cupriavidus nantongensis]